MRLEKEGRIEAPELFPLLAPPLWHLVELDLNWHIAGAGGSLDGWDKRRAARQTAFVMRFKLAHVRAVRPGGSARLLDSLSMAQREWLAAMNLGPRCFSARKGRAAGRDPRAQRRPSKELAEIAVMGCGTYAETEGGRAFSPSL